MDTLTDGNGSGLSITGPSFVSASAGSTSTTLLSSGVVTYTATYIISQGAANSGSVNNTVVATANTPGNVSQISDVSDDGDDTDGNITNDQTVIPTTTDISMAVYKTAITTDVNGNSKTDAGDVITYTIAIENTGSANLSGLTLVDTLTDGNSST